MFNSHPAIPIRSLAAAYAIAANTVDNPNSLGPHRPFQHEKQWLEMRKPSCPPRIVTHNSFPSECVRHWPMLVVYYRPSQSSCSQSIGHLRHRQNIRSAVPEEMINFVRFCNVDVHIYILLLVQSVDSFLGKCWKIDRLPSLWWPYLGNHRVRQQMWPFDDMQ